LVRHSVLLPRPRTRIPRMATPRSVLRFCARSIRQQPCVKHATTRSFNTTRSLAAGHQSSQQQQKSTHFGYETIPEAEKEGRVAGVFTNVAESYDKMNDFMSLGIHRLWKFVTIPLLIYPSYRPFSGFY
jgi:2-methoxy-6-polyprenyl-1,4-benzoquinol methylase